MREDEGTDVDITHDVFLIHANEPPEDKEFALHKLKPLLEEKGLRVLTDDEEFQGGQIVLDNIARAVRRCRKSVIVLTKHSNESPWCSLELLLALEKSHRHNIMSLVVLRKGDSLEEQLALDLLNTVPHVDIQSYDDIDHKLDDLVQEIKERKGIEELLPAGNIAHAQVWSHYFGLLQYLLPEIENLIKKTELYKKYPDRFSMKLYELVPENCRCPRVVEDIPKCQDESKKKIVVMEEKLPKLTYKRSGNRRNVEMTIYGIKDEKGEEFYCVMEYPAVILGIQKMIEDTCTRLRDCDRRIQLGRFYYTLTALLRHESLPRTLNKANVIVYNENRPKFVLAEEMLKVIKEDLHIGAINKERVERPLDRLSSREPSTYEYEAFLFYDDTDGKSQGVVDDIANYLETKDIKFYREDARPGQRKFNLGVAFQDCYWTIVVLTRKSLQNKEFTMKVLSLLEFFLGDKKIRLIPVLVDTRYCDIPAAIRIVTYVGVNESKKYLETLYCTLQGKEIPFDKDSLIPAGDVGYGLAWTYALNYLQFVLKGLGDSITNALEKNNKNSCIHRKKIYIIVPFSCDCKDTLAEADNKISYLDTIHPVYIDQSGNKREFTFDMYTFMDNGEEYVFAGQYAAPVTCLNEMLKGKIAGVNEEDMKKQSQIFRHEIEVVLEQKFGELRDSCEIVAYDDSKHQLSTEMKRRLKRKA